MERIATILVLEEPSERQALVQLLSDQGLQVVDIDNSEQALQHALQSPPDLFIVSLSLSNSWDFCWNIRHELGLKQIPIILMSQQRDIQQRLKALKLGINDFLCKPIDQEEFLARVLFLLEKAAEDQRKDVQRSTLQGELEVLSLYEIMEEINKRKQTGRLMVKTPEQQGYIHFLSGEVVAAELDPVKGLKALYRFLSFHAGTFRFEETDPPANHSIQVSFKTLIPMLSDYQTELQKAMRGIPHLQVRLWINFTTKFFAWGQQASAIQRHILALIQAYQQLQAILDHAPWDDLFVLQQCQELLQQDLVQIVLAGQEPSLPSYEAHPDQEEKASRPSAPRRIKQKEAPIEPALETSLQNLFVPEEPPPPSRAETVYAYQETNGNDTGKWNIRITLNNDEAGEPTSESAPLQSPTPPLVKAEEADEDLRDHTIVVADEPVPGNFSGKWHLRVRQEGIPVDAFFLILQLNQEGQEVEGTFLRKTLVGRPRTYEGTLRGTVCGSRLTVDWEDNVRIGQGVFELHGDQLDGQWTTSVPVAQGTWTGQRA